MYTYTYIYICIHICDATYEKGPLSRYWSYSYHLNQQRILKIMIYNVIHEYIMLRGTVADWLERLAGNAKVAGSRPVPAVIVSRDLEQVLYS